LNPVVTTDAAITVSQRENFIWVGRLTDQKNYEVLFEASKKVVHSINVYAKLYENAAFQERVKSSQNSMLKLNNFSPAVKHNMSTARALIITSKYEGLPNVMLEALSVGTPVITSYYVGGGHELLDSTNSRYYKDADELSEIINNFNDADFDAEKIIAKIKRDCSIDIIAKQYEVLFNG
jgi:glycosyltransferase involved in cell wall biosynthesis